MDELERLRAEIDGIDRELAGLFERRMACAEKIAAYKQAQQLPVADPERERQLLDRNCTYLENPALRIYYRDWLRHTMALSRARQRALRLEAGPAAYGVLPGMQSDLLVQPGALSRADAYFDLHRHVLVVTDTGVPACYAQAVCARCDKPVLFTVPQGEGSKAVPVWEQLLQTMQANGFPRNACVVAVGGGVVCDLAGFAAASYLRGIDCYLAPTTLLSQIDAAVGGKTALNFGGVKNQIGSFTQPQRVLIDPDTLKTLPKRQLVSGLAEALKMAVCFDPTLFALFETADLLSDPTPVLLPCLRHKLRLVEEDVCDRGSRRLLNFGHTIGHAIEAETGLLHGEAVALGMMPLCSEAVQARLLPIYDRLGLPTTLPCPPQRLIRLIRHDKKSHGDTLTVVVVPQIGAARLETVSFDELTQRLLRRFADFSE